jgi:predicted RNA polymerase sigma factor
VTSATQQAIDAAWRIESARLIAGLARVVRDVGLAEDLARDAVVAALEQWPESGAPGFCFSLLAIALTDPFNDARQVNGVAQDRRNRSRTWPHVQSANIDGASGLFLSE